jgi:hypothetical protein
MSVFLSPIGNGQQYLSVASQLAMAVGGTFNTYAAGTSTPTATYTSSSGAAPNPVSISIGANGTLPNPVWITGGTAIKIIILDALSNPIGPTYDNIYGINDPSSGGTAPATAVSYTPTGTGAVPTTVAAALNWNTINAFAFMTSAQIADVQARTLTQDVTAAVQAAINAIPPGTYPLGGWSVYFPPGTYKITSSLVIPLNIFNWRLTGSWAARLQMSGSSFDLLTFQSRGDTLTTITFGVIDNLGFDGGSIAGSGHLINTKWVGSTQFRDLLLTNLCTGGDGIHVVGNLTGPTYSHDILISNVYYNTTTGNAIIYMGPTSSDSIINIVKGNGGLGCKYGIYFDSGSAHCHVANSHPYNHLLNALWMGANTSAHWFMDCRFENCLADCASLNGTTNCSFTACMFTYAPANFADILLVNAIGNKFTNTTFTANSGVSKFAVNETGTSNNNAFNGYVVEGTFTSSPIFTIVGPTTAYRANGTDWTLSGIVNITAGNTIYIINGATAASAAIGSPCVYGGLATHLLIECDSAPGAGQSFTATVMDQGSSTGFTATISGASSFGAQAQGVTAVAPQDSLSIRVVASGGANASNIRACLVVNQ